MDIKFSKTTIDSLRVLINHARRDISYGAGGSYINIENDKFNKKDEEKAQRAIKFIETLINLN